MLDDVKAWQARPLEPLDPTLELDALFVKARRPEGIRKWTAYVALGLSADCSHAHAPGACTKKQAPS